MFRTTLHHRTRHPRRSRRPPPRRRPELELLEARNLLDGSKLGPLVLVTTGIPGYSRSDEAEPYFAVNPANPSNLVGTWTQDTFPGSAASGATSHAIGVAVTFNAGHTWQTSFIPGLTLATGGTFNGSFDSWLFFASNGDLYFTADAGNNPPPGSSTPSPNAILVEKSTDGGLTWSGPITLIESTDPNIFNDKDSVTADPTAPGYAYAVWDQITSNSGKGPVMFTRATNGGQSWDTARTIFPGNNQTDFGNQILVLPNGTLTDFFNVVLDNGHGMTLSLIQSTDKGQTWSSKATRVASIQSIGVTDPDTGQGVDAGSVPPIVFSVAEDPNNGNLYAGWTDARFSNSQYDSIAFSMSTDGGSNWSAPIQINQTPTNIPAGDQQAFLPSIPVAANGTVAVTYYDFRFNDSNPGLLTDHWLVEGTPGTDLTNPANWSNEVRLTNASFDMEKAAIWTGRGFWIGDYQGFAAAGNSFDAFFSATNGTDPGDIYFRDPPASSGLSLSDLAPSRVAADIPSRDALFALANALTPGNDGERTAFAVPIPASHNSGLTAVRAQPMAADQASGQASGSSIKQAILAGGTDSEDLLATDNGDIDNTGLALFAE